MRALAKERSRCPADARRSAMASPPPGHGARRRLRLPGDGAHEPAARPPSRRHRRGRTSSSARCLPATCCDCAPKARSNSATRSIRRRTCRTSGGPGPSCRGSRPASSAKDCPGIEIAALISHQLGLLTARAAVLAEQRLRQEGHGEAAVPLRARGARLRRPRREPARHGSGQRAGLRRRRRAAPTAIAGSRRSARTSPTFSTRSACPTARAA